MPSHRRIAKPLPVGPYDESQLRKLPYGSEMDALQMGLSRVSAYSDAVSRANKQTLINATTSGLNNATYAILDDVDHLLTPITRQDIKRIPGGPFGAATKHSMKGLFKAERIAFPQDGSLDPYGVPASFVPLPGGQRLFSIKAARKRI